MAMFLLRFMRLSSCQRRGGWRTRFSGMRARWRRAGEPGIEGTRRVAREQAPGVWKRPETCVTGFGCDPRNGSGWCRGARQKTPAKLPRFWCPAMGAQLPRLSEEKTRLFGVTETHTSADELSWYSIFALLSWVFACAHYPSREINDRKLRARKFGAMSLVEISTGDASRGFRSRRSVDAHSRSRFTTPTRFAKLQVRTRPDPPTYPFRIYPLHRPSFDQNAVPTSS